MLTPYGQPRPFTMIGSQEKKSFLINKNGTLKTNLKKLKNKNFLNKIVGDRGT
jgi:hypothetical protein